MSTVLNSPPVSSSRRAQDAPVPGPRHRLGWLREPLLHFLVIGAMLFALDAWIASGSDDPRVIVIDAAVDAQAIQVFRDARGRDPNPDELYGLRRVWLDNEVLYREGIAMQMDQGDQAIRDRVIFKALSSINAGLKLPPVNDDTLRAWFETNRVKYDQPARWDFSEAVLPEAQPTEAQARALAQQLNSTAGGEANAGLRVFKGRPAGNVVQSYGAEFAATLQALPQGEWRALKQAGTWRVMRVDGSTPPQAASFEPLRNAVLQDWTDAVLAEQRAAAVKTMAMKYTVQLRAPAPATAGGDQR